MHRECQAQQGLALCWEKRARVEPLDFRDRLEARDPVELQDCKEVLEHLEQLVIRVYRAHLEILVLQVYLDPWVQPDPKE